MFIPKEVLYASGIVGMLALGVFVGSSPERERNESAKLPMAQTAAAVGLSETDVNSPTTPSRGFNTPQPLPLADSVLPLRKGAEGEKTVKVVRVIDGDTIDVEIDGTIERVRYIGVDTPETVDPRKTVHCFGVEASKKNKELVEGKMVRLEKDITERDKYNRLLRYVYLKPQMGADTETQIDADRSGEILVNLALVEQGFATSYSYPPNIRYQDKIIAAEKKARKDKLGLWTACPTLNSSVMPTFPEQHSNILKNVGMLRGASAIVLPLYRLYRYT